MTYHAKLSPSGAHRWMACPGSVVLEADKPRDDNAYSEEGTAAHALAAMALSESRPCSAYVGRRVDVSEHKTVEVTAAMAEDVQRYVDNITAYATGNTMLVEQQVPIGHITGEEGASGTADVVVIADGGEELQVHDLKFGRGVAVSAEENPQLMLYALGALEIVAPLGVEPKRIRMVIHQPRITEAPSEWDCSLEALVEFGLRVEEASGLCGRAQERHDVMGPGGFAHSYLVPGDKQCRFCKAKATCPALAKFVEDSVGADFENLEAVHGRGDVVETVGCLEDDDLARKMAACDLIEDWIKSIRAEVERRLLSGTDVPGYKLVQGRAGARQWSDPTAAEEYLRKTVRLKVEEAYDLKLISPTTAEKLVKAGNIKPKQWARCEELIVRSEGRPSVAPISDKRPALVMTPTVDDFEEVKA